MATATSSIPAPVKRDIICEAGAFDCMVVDLLAGCYGHTGYMQESYGVTADRCDLVMRGVKEMPEFIKDEHGFDVTVDQVIAVMREAHARMEAHWDEQF